MGIALAVNLLCSSAALSDNYWYAAPDISYTAADHKRFAEDDIGLGLSLGRSVSPRLDFELGYMASRLPPKDDSGIADRKGLMLNSIFHFDPSQRLSPYGSLGFGAFRQKLQGDIDTLPYVSLGLGYTIPVPFMQGFDLQPEIRGIYVRNDKPDTHKNEIDGQALLRLRYAPAAIESTATAAAAAPPPVAIALAETQRAKSTSDLCRGVSRRSAAYAQNQCDRMQDRDSDGVRDTLDRCPNTIPGVRVDNDGCLIARR